MITASYDAVAGELILAFGDDRPPLSIPSPELHARFYTSGGLVSCRFAEDVVDVAFEIVEDDPGRRVVDQIDAKRWRLRFEYVNQEDPGP